MLAPSAFAASSIPRPFPKPTKKLKRLSHRNGIPLGQQDPGLVYNFRHLLLGDDLLFDELAAGATSKAAFAYAPSWAPSMSMNDLPIYCCVTIDGRVDLFNAACAAPHSSSASRFTAGAFGFFIPGRAQASGRSVPNCMWWFENGQYNSSDAAGQLSQ